MHKRHQNFIFLYIYNQKVKRGNKHKPKFNIDQWDKLKIPNMLANKLYGTDIVHPQFK